MILWNVLMRISVQYFYIAHLTVRYFLYRTLNCACACACARSTPTPQIKRQCHCINVILHWLRNVNEIRICTDISAYTSLSHSINPSNCLMIRWNYCFLYIANTNSILIMGFSFKLEVYFEGLLKPINSDKNLVAED